MRLLFLEDQIGWICLLPNAFRDLGHDVMISGPLTKQNIPQMISDFSPDLVIVTGWSHEHSPDKRNWIHNDVHIAGVPLIYWAVEDPVSTINWSWKMIKDIRPDFVFTVSKEKVYEYQLRGVRSAYLGFGYHPAIHCPGEIDPHYRCSIAVVANAYPHFLATPQGYFRNLSVSTLISPLLKQGIRIDFWGKGWEEASPFVGQDIPREWIHGYLPYTEARKVYNSADIVIGLQNYTHQVTQRTYEILASGGFLLTNDTSGVRELFVPEQDLAVSSSPEDTLKKVEYYLWKYSEERQYIQEQARYAVKEYTYNRRAAEMLEILKANSVIHPNTPIEKTSKGEWIFYGDTRHNHTVAPDETLWSIGQMYGVTVEQLKIWNGKFSDEVYGGLVLQIKK